jgi:hypothetical protein
MKCEDFGVGPYNCSAEALIINCGDANPAMDTTGPTAGCEAGGIGPTPKGYFSAGEIFVIRTFCAKTCKMIYPWVKSRGELSKEEKKQFKNNADFSANPRKQAEKFCVDWVNSPTVSQDKFSCKRENMILEGQCGTPGFGAKGGGSYCEPGGIVTWAGYYQMKELMVIREMCPETCDSVPVADSPDFAFFGVWSEGSMFRNLDLMHDRPNLAQIGVKCSVWADGTRGFNCRKEALIQDCAGMYADKVGGTCEVGGIMTKLGYLSMAETMWVRTNCPEACGIITNEHPGFVKHPEMWFGSPTMLIGARADGNISIWDTDTGVLDRQYSHNCPALWNAAECSQGLNAIDGNTEVFATAGDDNKTKLWTLDYLSTFLPIIEIPDIAPVVDVSVSLNNGIMTLNAAGVAKLYQYLPGSGKFPPRVEELLTYPGEASAIGFSPDSKFMYIGLANGHVAMVRVETLEVERTVGAPGHPVKSMAGSTFGNLLAVESEQIRVYGSAAFSAYVPAEGAGRGSFLAELPTAERANLLMHFQPKTLVGATRVEARLAKPRYAAGVEGLRRNASARRMCAFRSRTASQGTRSSS